jgi:hypothetical protein
MRRKYSKWRNALLLVVMVLVVVPDISFLAVAGPQTGKDNSGAFVGVCPPFFIRDEKGVPINPVKGENAEVPYSPKQTCGTVGCHDYEKITIGYHFQQGKDEEPSRELTKLYQWVLSPGQYGGRW